MAVSPHHPVQWFHWSVLVWLWQQLAEAKGFSPWKEHHDPPQVGLLPQDQNVSCSYQLDIIEKNDPSKFLWTASTTLLCCSHSLPSDFSLKTWFDYQSCCAFPASQRAHWCNLWRKSLQKHLTYSLHLRRNLFKISCHPNCLCTVMSCEQLIIKQS